MKSISGEGRGGTQSVISQRGARDGLFLRREGWEVVVIVNTTGSIGFSYFTLCLYNKIIACIKEEQEWGSVSWYLSFTHSYF